MDYRDQPSSEEDDVDKDQSKPMPLDPPATERQVDFLVSLSVPLDTARNLSMSQAAAMIAELAKHPTTIQKIRLMQRGYWHQDVEKMTREEATEIIARIAEKEGWHRFRKDAK